MPQNELYPRPRGAVGFVDKPPRIKWGRTSYISEPDFKRRLVRRSWNLSHHAEWPRRRRGPTSSRRGARGPRQPLRRGAGKS